MSDGTSSVFVYGTLLFDEVTTPLRIYSRDEASGAEVRAARCSAVLHGYERRTVHLRDHGNFPAIVPGSGSVHGHLLVLVSAESLVRMDEFEGIADGYYSRDVVTVDSGGITLEAFAYVCGEPLRSFLTGPWDPDSFRANDLAWYVRNVVSQVE